jgi:hypothetical protein
MATHLYYRLNEQKTCYDLLLAAWGNKWHANVGCTVENVRSTKVANFIDFMDDTIKI